MIIISGLEHNGEEGGGGAGRGGQADGVLSQWPAASRNIVIPRVSFVHLNIGAVYSGVGS